jgi:hypothetical protein
MNAQWNESLFWLEWTKRAIDKVDAARAWLQKNDIFQKLIEIFHKLIIFLPASIRSIPPGIHFALLLLLAWIL